MTTVAQVNLRREVHRLPPLLVEPVTRWLDRLHDECGQDAISGLGKSDPWLLVKLVACSEFAGQAILRDWPWFADELESGRILQVPRQEILAASLRDKLRLAPDLPGVKRELREFRNRQMVAILWRDLSDVCEVTATIAALSDLADVIIECTSDYVRAGLAARFGEVPGMDGQPMSLIVLAMGKLGGQELNFSSDIDLVFLYPGDGESNGVRRLSANEFFTRWAQS